MAESSSQAAILFLHVIMAMESKPKINWDYVAQKMSLKNGKVAATRFSQVKKKLEGLQAVSGNAYSGETTGALASPKRKAAVPISKRGKQKEEVEDNDTLGDGSKNSNEDGRKKIKLEKVKEETE